MAFIQFKNLKTIKMGIEELYENKVRYQDNNRERRYPVNNEYVHESYRPSYGQDNNINWLHILQRIRSDKKLKLFVILAGLLVLTLLIVLIVVLLPIILKLVSSISQTGLSGILKDITGFLGNIMK
jgi:hypothetical protein